MAMLRKPVVAGRRLVVPTRVRTVRDKIREYLAFEHLTIKHDLSRMLGISPVGAASLMTKRFPLAPQHIDAIVDGLRLDEFDAHELRLMGAIEAGWQLHIGEHLK